MNSFITIVKKEIKELARDPKILFGVVLLPLLLYPIMGQSIRISQESVLGAITSSSLIYSDDIGTIANNSMTYFIKKFNVTLIQASSLNEALLKLTSSSSAGLIHIPSGYSYNITNGLTGYIKIYGDLKKFNNAEAISAQNIGTLVYYWNIAFSEEIIKQLLFYANQTAYPAVIRNPVTYSFSTIIKGNVVDVAPSQIMNVITSQSMMMPIMIMMMVIFAVQMAATSIALEKEQKTLETLMTLPVGRLTILGGKLAGSIVIAIAGSISYMIGFGFYTQSVFSFVPQMTSLNLGETGVGIQPIGYALLGIVMFVTLVSALALAISLAVFTDNVRSAQSLTSIIIVPIIIPAIILMFSDLDMLPATLQWVLLAIPYTHSMLATKAAFLGDHLLMLRSIAYISIFTLAMLWVAAKLFSTERIITSRFTTFSLRRKR